MEEQKNKLYVGNLPYTVSDEQLGEMFAGIGEIEEAKLSLTNFQDAQKALALSP